MLNKIRITHQLIKYFLIVVLIANVQIGLADVTTNSDNTHAAMIVLDIELLGDTSVESMKDQDIQLIKKFSGVLRRSLKEHKSIDVIDDAHSIAMIEQAAQDQYLHRCNGCELQMGKTLGAKQVIVPWVFRMSKLVQTMYVEIRDVETGRIVMRKGLDFRGNTDNGWAHVINRHVQEIAVSVEATS